MNEEVLRQQDADAGRCHAGAGRRAASVQRRGGSLRGGLQPRKAVEDALDAGTGDRGLGRQRATHKLSRIG